MSSLAARLAALGNGQARREPWAMNAAYAFDFTKDICWIGRNFARGIARTNGWSFSRASQAYALTQGGVLTSFASGSPRITDRGFLLEASRTNLILRSQTPNLSTWTTTRASYSADSTVAPDGTATADTLIEDSTASNTHLDSQQISGNSTTEYTFSRYFKAGSRTKVCLQITNAAFTKKIGQYFDLSAGTVGSANDFGSPTTKRTSTIEALADGWYRCTIGGVLNSGGGAENIFAFTFLTNNTETISYSGDGASGLYIWGAQLEAAQGASSYIATTTASVTRAADVAAITAALTYPLTLFAEFEPVAETAGNRIQIQVDTGTNNERAYLQHGSGGATAGNVIHSGATEASVSIAGPLTVGSRYKVAVRVATNDVTMARNGSLSANDNAVALPTNPTEILIGQVFGGTGQPFEYLRRLAIYQSALTDAQLQALTA